MSERFEPGGHGRPRPTWTRAVAQSDPTSYSSPARSHDHHATRRAKAGNRRAREGRRNAAREQDRDPLWRRGPYRQHRGSDFRAGGSSGLPGGAHTRPARLDRERDRRCRRAGRHGAGRCDRSKARRGPLRLGRRSSGRRRHLVQPDRSRRCAGAGTGRHVARRLHAPARSWCAHPFHHRDYRRPAHDQGAAAASSWRSRPRPRALLCRSSAASAPSAEPSKGCCGRSPPRWAPREWPVCWLRSAGSPETSVEFPGGDGVGDPSIHEAGEQGSNAASRFSIHGLGGLADEYFFVELAGSASRTPIDMACESLQ